jgi:hypothetical protein
MKHLFFLGFVLMTLASNMLCNAQVSKKTQNTSNTKIEAYYFHNTSRCVTCKAVEAEAKADLENLYGSQVVFKAFNLEEDATNDIAKKLEISGQTLLIVKGNQKIDLTNEGFMYARTNPAKFKSIIKTKVDKLIN